MRRLSALLVALALSSAPAWADPITQTSGIAGKDIADGLTWKHLSAVPTQTPVFTPSASRFFLPTISVLYGCDATCTNWNSILQLDPQDGVLTSNNSVFTFAALGGYNGTTIDRLRVSPTTDTNNTGILAVANLAFDPSTGSMSRIRAGINSDSFAIGGVLGAHTLIFNGSSLDRWRGENVDNPTVVGSVGNVRLYIAGAGGTTQRVWSGANAGAGGAAQTCGGCIAINQYSSDGTSWRANKGVDLDTGAGTDWNPGVSLRLSASGGSVEAGTATNPIRTDPTGTTTQPVSGTVTANQGTPQPSPSPWSVGSVQGATLFNSETTSAADTAITITMAAAANVRAHVYRLDARCSAGTASLTVTDGGTTIWSSIAAEITTTRFTTSWQPGVSGSTNSAVVITLSTCGAGNTGTLSVQADRF